MKRFVNNFVKGNFRKIVFNSFGTVRANEFVSMRKFGEDGLALDVWNIEEKKKTRFIWEKPTEKSSILSGLLFQFSESRYILTYLSPQKKLTILGLFANNDKLTEDWRRNFSGVELCEGTIKLNSLRL